MDIVEAKVRNEGEKYFLDIAFADDTISVPLSEDSPNKVKSAFNQLIARVRAGEFEIVLKALGEDLFSQVANEYVSQLNREIAEIHEEMQTLGLLAEPSASPA